jgi:hypothetical protein
MSDHLQKHTLNLRRGDWEFITSLAKPQGVDTSLVVRKLVSKFVDEQRSLEAPVDTTKFEVTL